MFNLDMGILFIHPPKTGGCSLMRLLCPWERVLHYSLRHYEARSDWPMLGRLLSVGNIRNPWDRLVSAWSFLRESGRIGEAMTFGDYVRWHEQNPEPLRLESNKDWLQPGPAVEWLRGSGCEVGVDYVCCVGTYDDDFGRISPLFGGATLERLNVSSHEDYRCYYEAKTADAVGRIYRGDLDVFGFTFDDLRCEGYERVRRPEKLAAALSMF